jgi:hypothetical protein
MASGAMGGTYFERAAAEWLFMNIDHSTYFYVYKSKEQNTCLIVPRQKDTEISALTFVISSDSLFPIPEACYVAFCQLHKARLLPVSKYLG